MSSDKRSEATHTPLKCWERAGKLKGTSERSQRSTRDPHPTRDSACLHDLPGCHRPIFLSRSAQQPHLLRSRIYKGHRNHLTQFCIKLVRTPSPPAFVHARWTLLEVPQHFATAFRQRLCISRQFNSETPVDSSGGGHRAGHGGGLRDDPARQKSLRLVHDRILFEASWPNRD